MSKFKVLLIVGGDSSERAVSLDSGRCIYQALVHLGHDVLIADPARPDIEPTDEPDTFFSHTAIDETPPDLVKNPYPARARFLANVLTRFDELGRDLVFNGLHGGVGEDGTIQAAMDYLGIRYTGSGATACALAMDKAVSKKLARLAEVPVARDIVVDSPAHEAVVVDRKIAKALSFPLVVKPNREGSSVGVRIVKNRKELQAAIREVKKYDTTYLVEKFIPGREITAAMLDYCELPLIRIAPKNEDDFFDYKNKYQKGSCEYIVPADIKEFTRDLIATSALRMYRALGCRGYARIDFRLSNDGYHFFLEANTLPGMTDNSLVPMAAKAVGIDFAGLIDRIVKLAMHEIDPAKTNC